MKRRRVYCKENIINSEDNKTYFQAEAKRTSYARVKVSQDQGILHYTKQVRRQPEKEKSKQPPPNSAIF